jgi:hypothetical protein
MNRIVVVAIGLIVSSVATHARAEEPTGFTQYPWGTAPNIVATEVIQKKGPLPGGSWCATAGLSGGTSIQENYAWCEVYVIQGCCTVDLTLRFDATGLANYGMNLLDFPLYGRFRAVVLDKFGPPHTSTSQEYVTGAGQRVKGEVLGWQWATAGASLIQICGKVTQPCLVVGTNAFFDARTKQDTERREKAKRGF